MMEQVFVDRLLSTPEEVHIQLETEPSAYQAYRYSAARRKGTSSGTYLNERSLKKISA